MMNLPEVNWLALIVASLAGFMLGALWYSPVLFSKLWQKEVGLSDKDATEGNMLVIFGTSFVFMLIMSLGLALFLQFFDPATLNFGFGALMGTLVGIFYSMTSVGINVMYQRKSMRLFLIDAGYQVLYLALVGGILAIWM
jgi:hypothetical protein